MGKHSIEKPKSKKIVGKVILTIVILGIIAAIVYGIMCIERKEEPEKVANNLFSALKESNKSEANKYTNYDQLITSLDEMLLTNDEEQMSNAEKELFNSIEWKIENSEINENNTTVIVEMTNKDLKTALTKWMKKIVSEKVAGTTISNEIALEKLEEILKDEQIEKKTVIKRITLVNTDGSWEVQVDDNLRDLVFPGIDSVANVLNKN